MNTAFFSSSRGSRMPAAEIAASHGPATTNPLPASRIASVGVALPERRVSTQELMARCRPAARLDLEALSGVRERRVCSDDESSYTLARDAALDCLARARCSAGDLDVVVSCSITHFTAGLRFGYEPPVSLSVRQAIGARRAMHFDVTNACAGMLTGLLVVDAMIRRGLVGRGLVVAGECISNLGANATREMRTIASRQMASLTLGDAGAAILLERAGDSADRVESIVLETFPRWDALCIGRPCRSAPGASMHTNARKLHRVAIESSIPLIERALGRLGLGFDDVDLYVPHQTSLRAILGGEKRISAGLGVPSRRRNIAITLDAYGNTASTAIFVALHDALQRGAIARGRRALLMCFASGVVVGAVVLTLDALVERCARPH